MKLMVRVQEPIVKIDREILEVFADAQRLRFNGHNITKHHDDNWNGSWDNAITRIEEQD